MLFTNPLHAATRRVLLPKEWDNTPESVQVNYYNYLQTRLIPATDVYIGTQLVYRTNAVGCRGDDLLPDRPIMALFGDQTVHGTLEEIPFADLKVEPFQIVNAGIEDAAFTDVMTRVGELHEVAPLSWAVIFPAPKDLAPTHLFGFIGPPCAEKAWEGAMEHLPTGPNYVVVLPPDMNEWPDQGLARRLVAYLRTWAESTGATLLDARPAPVRTGFFQRLFGRGPAPAPSLCAFLRSHLDAMTISEAAAPQRASAEPAAPRAAVPAGAHGPEDVGKNYPLW